MIETSVNRQYIQINLSDIIKGIGEEQTKKLLSYFSCPLNKDVGRFLREKAIEFSKRDFSKTYLVYWSNTDGRDKELVGYYTIAHKSIFVPKDNISKQLYKKISQFGEYDTFSKCQCLPAILIAQLGKNYTTGNDTLIKGSDLLYMALERIKNVQYEIGGRYTYLECEDKPKLINFYETNGFLKFGKRYLDKDEVDINGSYLIQLIKKI